MRHCAFSLQRIDLAEYLLMRYVQNTVASMGDAELSKIDIRFLQLGPFAEMVGIYCAYGRLEDAVKGTHENFVGIQEISSKTCLSVPPSHQQKTVLQHVKNANLTPTSHIFTPIIQSCTTQHDLPLATKALESLLNSKQHAAPHLYNHILNLCFSASPPTTENDEATHPSATIAPKTLAYLFEHNKPTAQTFQLLFDQCNTQESLFTILKDMESSPTYRPLLSAENVQSSILWANIRTSRVAHGKGDDGSVLTGSLDLAARITNHQKRFLTPGAAAVLAKLYLANGDLSGSFRVLKKSIEEKRMYGEHVVGGDLRRVVAFLGDEFLNELSKRQRQGEEGLDTTLMYNFLDVWTREVGAMGREVGVKSAAKVVELFGLTGDFVTLRLVYACIQSGDGGWKDLPMRLKEDQWKCLVGQFCVDDVRFAVSFLKAAVSLRTPDFEFAQKVVTDFVAACGEENKQVAVAGLLEVLLKENPYVGNLEQDSKVRKLAAGVVVEVVKRDLLTDESLVKDLEGVLPKRA
ncbi:UNVERIFIED_CONTAM: hypothetical protein HDU68_005068 [Siphonaria sp. JEL0065]|nr:hypothetical protein HDU68_005068 [Siphonaria sp. JEL0065]